MSGKYSHPTDGVRDVGVTEDEVRLDVCHIKEPRSGTNCDQGSWVVIRYDIRNDMFDIEYITGGKMESRMMSKNRI